VIDNSKENDFLDRLLRRLGFNVLVATKADAVGQELAQFVPDLVFASMIGKKSNTLEALAKVKASRGIPKVIFVRPAQETKPLTKDQKLIIDGLLKSPIDPFDLLSVLAEQLELSLEDLKEKYRKIIRGDRDQSSAGRFGSLLKFDQTKVERYAFVAGQISEDHSKMTFDSEKLRKKASEQEKEAEQNQSLVDLKKDFVNKLYS